jgi:hypothetical protein
MTTVIDTSVGFVNGRFYPFEKHSATSKGIVFSSYRYGKTLQKWLWFHIEGDAAYVSPYCHSDSGFTISTSVVGLWNCKNAEWVLNEAAYSFDGVWVAAQCHLSTDKSCNQKAYVASCDREISGLEACKWFQAELKSLNNLSDHIQAGFEFLKINTHLSEWHLPTKGIFSKRKRSRRSKRAAIL